MKLFLRFAATRIDVGTYERLLAHSILKNAFKPLKTVRVFECREDLWDDCLENQIAGPTSLTFVEFGVHTGYSIKYFARKNSNQKSVFIGLDSFEGLPEGWGGLAKGAFDTQGVMPQVDDSRVTFVKGWFQNTWGELVGKISNVRSLIVHYDADLYSSTLFALTKIDSLKTPYIAIFDEFAGHEARALYNYLQSYNATVTFLGKTIAEGYPVQVMCKISPQ
jgi:hypothetical protein